MAIPSVVLTVWLGVLNAQEKWFHHKKNLILHHFVLQFHAASLSVAFAEDIQHRHDLFSLV
jgi:hypothetical protein